MLVSRFWLKARGRGAAFLNLPGSPRVCYNSSMSTIEGSHQAFHRGTAPIFSLLTAEQIRQLAEVQGDATLEARFCELAEKANEGDLSDFGPRRLLRINAAALKKFRSCVELVVRLQHLQSTCRTHSRQCQTRSTWSPLSSVVTFTCTDIPSKSDALPS